LDIPKDAQFFVFSNDMPWIKERMEEHGLPKERTTFVEGNFDYTNNYVDMMLMSKCNVLICAGDSTFSYLAYLLNQTPDFYGLQTRHASTDDIAVMDKPQVLKELIRLDNKFMKKQKHEAKKHKFGKRNKRG
jgi:hypothetical protein